MTFLGQKHMLALCASMQGGNQNLAVPQAQHKHSTAVTHHGLVGVVQQDESSSAVLALGVVQVAPDEDGRGQQEAQRQQNDQDHAHYDLASVASEQVCTA